MKQNILLITPPFTQLNTPYPATPYLTSFLKQHGCTVAQADLGIELMNKLFSREGLSQIFQQSGRTKSRLLENSRRILDYAPQYLDVIDPVMNYLQHRDTTLAQVLCSDSFLPKASRFGQLKDPDWYFGRDGIADKARFLATLFIEDIGDLLKDAITPFFGFTRYAEKLGLSAHSFTSLDRALRKKENIIETWLLGLLNDHLVSHCPDVVGITIPFPGNLYGALKCGQFIKKRHPRIKVIAGGGYVNTELRELSDPAVFNYFDYITLDDGEIPLLHIMQSLSKKSHPQLLKRTFIRRSGKVIQVDNALTPDPPASDVGFPDYTGLLKNRYLSLMEIPNPMHRLWSDGQWNKLTLAHGCYWHKCAFCDTSLDYIRRFDTAPASVLVDRIEKIMAQTGKSGFHFVDEAAPPAVLNNLASELLKRRVRISWWTNIRFESAFTEDLCHLLAASGCIAVTGGLETASDRLLALMIKGITIHQAAQACAHFNSTGVMVHAYLMYGFPTQTEQETVDSLEIVRQFFHEGLIQSAFWHQFTATIHSDVGRDPAKYRCRIKKRPRGGFAVNDLAHVDPTGCDHQRLAPGLNKAVYNFMHGIGTDIPVEQWFDVPVPAAGVKRNTIRRAISNDPAPGKGPKR